MFDKIKEYMTGLVVTIQDEMERKNLDDTKKASQSFRMTLKTLYSDGAFDYYDNVPTSFIRPDKDFFVIIDGTYPEVETNKSATLTDNTTSYFEVGDTTYNRFIKIEATFTRGTEIANATLNIDPISQQVWTDWYPFNSNLGLTIGGVSISGNAVRVDYTTTSTGTNITMKANYNRVMK